MLRQLARRNQDSVEAQILERHMRVLREPDLGRGETGGGGGCCQTGTRPSGSIMLALLLLVRLGGRGRRRARVDAH